MSAKTVSLLAALQENGFSLWKSYQAVFNVAPKPASVRVAELLRKTDFLDALIRYVDKIDRSKLTDLEFVACQKLLNRAMEKLALLGYATF